LSDMRFGVAPRTDSEKTFTLKISNCKHKI
jgi:hypothetical protein